MTSNTNTTFYLLILLQNYYHNKLLTHHVPYFHSILSSDSAFIPSVYFLAAHNVS